jgi:exodeoxyribonuclease VII small subunit
MASKKPTAAEAEPASYEEALHELEGIVRAIEDGSLTLEQTLASYQRGAFLLNYCRDKLAVVEQQVKVLEEGALKPFLAGDE